MGLRHVQAPKQDRVLVYATLPSDVIVPSNDPVHLKVPKLAFCTSAPTGATSVASKLSLFWLKHGNVLSRMQAVKAALQALKSIGMDGVVVEVWWGHVEASAPHCYNWSTYDIIFDMLKHVGLRGQVRNARSLSSGREVHADMQVLRQRWRRAPRLS